MSELTPEFFEDAAEWLDEHGWTRGMSCDRAGRVCAVGALIQATPSTFGYSQMRYQIFQAHDMEIAELMGVGPYKGIVCWNDTEARSGNEVRDRFMLAAKTLREQGR